MDGMFAEYERRLVFNERIADRFVIMVYSSEDEYYANGGKPNSAACFLSARRALIAYRPERDEDQLFRGLYHEGMHQYLHFHMPNPPIWFDEGLAEYFETGRPIAGPARGGEFRFRIGVKNAYAARELKDALRRGAMVPVERLIALSRDEFYSEDESLLYLHYAEAWALTHMMLESKNARLKRLWLDYFAALRNGASQAEANEQVFGRVSLPSIEQAFRRYVGAL
jgi:hypothetical protein